MVATALLLALSQSVAGLNDVTVATFTCDLALPGRTPFRLEGRFDESGMHSNLSTLTHMEGDFVPVPTGPNEVVMLDGSQSYRWSLERGSMKFSASMTRYLAGPAGNAAPTALFVLDGHRQVAGRHWGRFFGGAGLCEVRNVRTGEARR